MRTSENKMQLLNNILAYLRKEVKNKKEVEIMIVDRIRDLCKEHGTSIMRLEQATGIKNGNIRRWDDHVPSVTKVKAVADYFGVTVDTLLKEDEPDGAKEADYATNET